MDYGRPELADRLAADYAVGTMRGAARRRFESLLPAHAALRHATLDWNDRLMPLTAGLTPIAPSTQVWRRIAERIGISDEGRAASSAAGARPRLAFWRGLAAFASVAAIALAVLVVTPQAVPPPIVVVLAATGAGAGGAQPGSIVASISGDGRALVARPLTPVSVRADRALELWAIPPGGAPRSLGVMPGAGGTMALPAEVLKGTDTLAVTLEPAGGAPHGAPTGPVLYAGKFTI